jgi:predicted amidophosphoribosyltransferase
MHPAAQEEISLQKSPTRPTCPVCGTPAPQGAHFCTRCGASLKQVVLSQV